MEQSTTINKLAAALIQFSGKMLKVKKDSVNPHFRNRYASLSTIIETTQPALVECGLAVVQMPSGDNELTTVLLHESGEYISSTYRMTPSKNDPQGLGSAITYQRRYAYGAILNLNIDEDDDGNTGSQNPNSGTSQPDKWLNETTKEGAITKEWENVCAGIRDGKITDVKDVEKHYKVANATKEKIEVLIKTTK